MLMHRWKVPTLANLFLSGILIDSSAAPRRVKRGPQVCCVGPQCTFGALARWQVTVNINIVGQILPFTILHPDWRFIGTTSVSVVWPLFGKNTWKLQNLNKNGQKQGRNSLHAANTMPAGQKHHWWYKCHPVKFKRQQSLQSQYPLQKVIRAGGSLSKP